jgi:hypothetical protein
MERSTRQLVLLHADKKLFWRGREISWSGIRTAFVVGVKRLDGKIEWGWQMKIQNIFRTHVVVIGFAAAFGLAGGARAQEIDNTVWADNSNVESFPQPAPATFANELSTAVTNSVQANTAAVVSQTSVNNETIVSGGATNEGWLIATSILLIAPLGLFMLAKVRRARQNVNAREYHSKRSASLS